MKRLTRYAQSFMLTVGLLLSLLASHAAIAAVDQSDVISAIKSPAISQASNNQATDNNTLDNQIIALHDNWNTLLSRHVKPINQGHSSAVDYAAMQQDRAILTLYLKQLRLNLMLGISRHNWRCSSMLTTPGQLNLS